MSLRTGSNESGSPSDDDQVEVDAPQGAENPPAERNAEAQVETTAVAEPPDTDQVDDAEAQPKAAKPKPKPSKPSPVDEAIERLTAPKPEDDDAETPAAQPTGTATPKPKASDAAATDAPATGEGQTNVDDEKPDPLSDWSPEERKHTKGKTKERFRKLHEAYEQDRPHAEIGRGFRALVDQHQLAPDLDVLPDEGMVVAIRTQAAALRIANAARAKQAIPEADVAWLQKNREAIDTVLGMAGRAAPAAAPAEDLSKVEITQEVRDLKDAFGVVKDEDELRAVQAALNRHRAPKGKPAAAKPADEKPTEQRSAPAAPVASTVPWTNEDEQLAKAAMRRDLIASGVPKDQLAGHFAKNLVPLVSKEVAELMPGVNPDQAWARLSPIVRRDLVKQAQSAWTAKAKPASTNQRVRAPSLSPVSGTGSRASLMQRAATSGKGAVNATIAAMCGEETE